MFLVTYIVLSILLSVITASKSDRNYRGLVSKKENTSKYAANQQFAFVHIPKTAGSSFLELSPQHMLTTQTIYGHEWCWEAVRGPGKPQMVTMVRNPRTQVLSQYFECRHDVWGITVTAGSDFPRSGESMADFERWLDHFLNKSTWDDAFNCYDPWNMQTHSLVCEGEKPHMLPDRCRKPSVVHARDILGQTIVLVKELFPESLCLFHYLATGQLGAGCHTDCTVSSPKEKHIVHDVPAHHIEDASSSVLDKIDTFIHSDVLLYEAAVIKFFSEVEIMERELKANILCGNRIADIWASISDLLTNTSVTPTDETCLKESMAPSPQPPAPPPSKAPVWRG